MQCLLKVKINCETITSQRKNLKQLNIGNIANKEVLKMYQESAKTEMRFCIQMPMMRRQKTYLIATLAHQKKHVERYQSRFNQKFVKTRVLLLQIKKQIEIGPSQSEINGTNRGTIIIENTK